MLVRFPFLTGGAPLLSAVLISAAVGLITPVASATRVTGSTDDWEGAVCKLGTLMKSNYPAAFRNAFAGDSCVTKTNPQGPIFIGQWNGNNAMRSDISHFRGMYYASAIDGNNTITDFVGPSANSGAALQPLTQFGFGIYPVPG